MKHEDYKKAIDQDKEFCDNEVNEWRRKLETAKHNLEYWESQAKAICSVSCRVGITDNSPFPKPKE